MITVGVLYGGRSGEHDVSLCSAASVVSTLNKNKYEIIAIGIDRDGRWYVQDKPEIVNNKDFGNCLSLKKTGSWLVNHYNENNKLVLFEILSSKRVEVDVVFPVVHGTFCEDGTLQGLLELAMVPYVGADVIGSSIGMDKDVAKRLMKESSIPVVDWMTITTDRWEKNREKVIKAVMELSLPIFVKPANTGSSVGISRVKGNSGLVEAVDFALQFDRKVLIEKAVDCREIECSVIGNNSPRASVLGEIISSHDFYSYEAKYIDPDGAELRIPAEMDESVSSKMREVAVKAYRKLCCSGMARIDFFLEKDSSRFYLNEINTIPGFTSISMYPKLWQESGLNYSDLLEELIQLSIERHEAKLRVQTVF